MRLRRISRRKHMGLWSTGDYTNRGKIFSRPMDDAKAHLKGAFAKNAKVSGIALKIFKSDKGVEIKDANVLDRIGRLVTGMLLYIPLINVIVDRALRGVLKKQEGQTGEESAVEQSVEEGAVVDSALVALNKEKIAKSECTVGLEDIDVQVQDADEVQKEPTGIDLNEGLEKAVKEGNKEQVKFFLEKGADPTVGLEEAIWSGGDIEIVRLCLENGADASKGIDLAERLGRKDIETRCRNFRSESRTAVADGGKEIRSVNEELKEASRRRDKKQIKALLSQGANPRNALKEGVAEHAGIFHICLQYIGKAEEEFKEAIIKGDLKKARKSISSGALGSEGLETAVKAKNIEMIKLCLVDKGKDLESMILSIVIKEDDEDLAKFVFDNIVLSMDRGLDTAIYYENEKFVKFFLNRGVDAERGKEAARIFNKPGMGRLCSEYKKAATEYKKAATKKLIKAIRSGSKKKAEKYLLKGADATKGLMECLEYSVLRIKIMKLCLDKGADPMEGWKAAVEYQYDSKGKLKRSLMLVLGYITEQSDIDAERVLNDILKFSDGFRQMVLSTIRESRSSEVIFKKLREGALWKICNLRFGMSEKDDEGSEEKTRIKKSYLGKLSNDPRSGLKRETILSIVPQIISHSVRRLSQEEQLPAESKTMLSQAMPVLEKYSTDPLSSIFKKDKKARNVWIKDVVQRHNRGETILLPVHTKNHFSTIVLSGKYLAICNRGGGISEETSGMQMMKIGSPENLEAALKQLYIDIEEGWFDVVGTSEKVSDTQDAVDQNAGEKSLAKQLGLKRIHVARQKLQKAGNCPWASTKAGFRAVLFFEEAKRRGLLEPGVDLNNVKNKAALKEVEKVTFEACKSWTIYDRQQAQNAYKEIYTPYTEGADSEPSFETSDKVLMDTMKLKLAALKKKHAPLWIEPTITDPIYSNPIMGVV